MKSRPRRLRGESVPFDELVGQLVVPTFVVGTEGKVLVWNQACEQLTGMPAHEVVDTADHWRAFYSHERPCLADLIAQERTDCVPDLYISTDSSAAVYGGLHAENWCDMPLRGVRLYLSIDAGPIHDAEGNVIAVVETLRDWTAWKNAESELRLIKTVFENASEGIVVTDAAKNILMVNPAFSQITGYAPEEVVGKTPRVKHSGMQDEAFYREMWAAIETTGQWEGEIWNRRKDGEIYPENLFINAVCDSRGAVTNYIALFSDITRQKQVQERLEDMATHDALTGLPNRIALSVRLHQALALANQHNRLVAVCFIDLDGFKPINDTYGHEVGDRVLVEIARRLKGVIRGSDTVARIGGDEFIVVLSEFSNMDEIEIALGRILNTLSNAVAIDATRLNVSASIGVTVHPFDESDTDTLIRHADQAMYVAKNMGRNTWRMYDMEDGQEVQRIGTMLGRVREALQKDEFRLYFQPKVNMRTGEIVGMEALIRWEHPERGIVPPGEFLPLVENSPVIVDLGAWVIHEALRQISSWLKMGLRMKVSVNIAARQFQHIDFVMSLRSILAQHPDVPHSLLGIEVLESTALDDVDNVRAIVLACQEMGIDCALDDFGTGYSTLTYLRRLPARELKIDQTFIRDMLDDREDLALVEGVIGLASVFRMGVIAEGVETLAQGIVLLRIGCDVVQGYYIAKPMPAEAVPAWCAAFSPSPEWHEWAKTAWDRSHLPLVLAEYDHLKWVQGLLAMLEGAEVEIPPAEIADPHACRFGQWYDREGKQQYGNLKDFADINAIHVRLHEVASDMVHLHAAGDQESARSQSQVLSGLKDAIVDKLGAIRGVLLC